MSNIIVEFDDAGDAEGELAQLWVDAAAGERDRVTAAASEVERILARTPNVGLLITNGSAPPVRYLDCDILRAFYHWEAEFITIIGFNRIF